MALLVRLGTQERIHEGDAGRGLRILSCAFACNPSGSSGGEDVLGWNVIEQISKGHEVWVLTSSENRGAINEALRKHPIPSARFCYFDLPWWMRSLRRFPGGIQCYAYLWQVCVFSLAWRLHRRYRFDLFHHVTYANDWMASFIGALLPIPYIRGPGGGAHRVPRAFLREFPPAQRCWESLRSLGQWLFRHDPIFITSQHRARALLVCNQEALAAIPQRWQKKAHLFPVNGVSDEDLRRLSNHAEVRKLSGFTVLMAGKLLRLKGFPLALKAFQRFSDRYPDGLLRIIGDGPDRSALCRLIQTLRLEGCVHLEPWMPRLQLFEALRTCDVFLFPSLRDGGGQVVIEALAAGKPVICLDVGGPRIHVSDGCGIKIPADSPEQAIQRLAEALERLYLDEDLRRHMGQAARTRAYEEYRWDRLGERLLAIYEEALGPRLGVLREGEQKEALVEVTCQS